LTKLNKLFLSGNNISSIKGLETLQNLETLDLGNNHIKIIRGLESLMTLKDLWIKGNDIDDNLLDQLGGIDSSGCAVEPLKFVEYCLINL
jgi:Leucine-rich repeat (LRR) protein